MASIITSMPLFGESSPNVRTTDLPANDFDFLYRNTVDGAQQFAAFLGHDDNLRRDFDDVGKDAPLHRVGRSHHRVKRGDERYVQSREQRQHVSTGLTAEDAELMLEGYDVESTGVQDVRRVRVVLHLLILDLRTNDVRIVVCLAVIRHRNDCGLDIEIRDGLLQIVGERSNSAAPRKRVTDERHTNSSGHDRTSKGGWRTPRQEKKRVNCAATPAS
jgi:hypothetical protein